MIDHLAPSAFFRCHNEKMSPETFIQYKIILFFHSELKYRYAEHDKTNDLCYNLKCFGLIFIKLLYNITAMFTNILYFFPGVKEIER